MQLFQKSLFVYFELFTHVRLKRFFFTGVSGKPLNSTRASLNDFDLKQRENNSKHSEKWLLKNEIVLNVFYEQLMCFFFFF